MEKVDFFIIGAGAAGLTAALYASRSGLSVTVAEEAGSGGQALQIFDLENYPGIFPAVSGIDFAKNLEKQAETFGASIIQSEVLSIDKKSDGFYIKTLKGEYVSKAVLLATGAEHRELGVKGEKEFFGKGVSYCAVCDGPFFRNKDVVVVGGGDSAGSEALYLAGIASSVTLIHRRNELRCQKAIEEKLMAEPKIHLLLNKTVESINGGEDSASKDFVGSVTLIDRESKEKSQIKTSAVFIFAGMNPKSRLIENLPKDESGYIKTNEKMETLVPGLLCAGDVRSKPLRQIVTAASDGAVAAFTAKEYIASFCNSHASKNEYSGKNTESINNKDNSCKTGEGK